VISEKIRGALWKVLASMTFVAVNGVMQHLHASLETVTIVFFQNLIGFCILFPFMDRKNLWSFHRKRGWVHILRAGCGTLGMLSWCLAVRYLPLAEAVALGFMGPLISLLGAIFFLREKVNSARVWAIYLGFLGGCFIMHGPNFLRLHECSFRWALLWLPLISSAFFSVTHVLNKFLVRYDSPLVVVGNMQSLTVLFLAGFVIPDINLALPLSVWAELLLFGGLSALAMFSLTRSFACTDLTFLMPIGSLRFVLTALLGFLWFHQVPSVWVLLGFVIIFVGINILFLFDRKRS
jgi:drug/metabolite transporter (DMT)-like permease